MIGIGVAAVEIGGHLIGSVQAVSEYAAASRSSYRECVYIQRQLGNPVRYPDLVTAYKEGAVWEHRRLLSGYCAVLRGVVLAF
jgi:hypothetical protein